MESINDFMPNSNDWNSERLQTLKHLYPDWFTNEGNLNIDEIKKAVNPSLINETERYEFRWFGKSQAKRDAFIPSNATLVFDENRSVNPDNTENLIIEGENLEVLKLLSNSYRGQIKCIYIDPPYNTGNDFVYSDKYTQDKKGYWENAEYIENGVKIDTNTETDGRYHSNWLNMMYSRLLIARQLLREDGLIFISIDDNEVHHLRKLCDEVFGEENFLSEIIVRANSRGQTYNQIAKTHEYILIYCKSDEGDLYEIEKSDSSNDLNLEDNIGKFNIRELRNRNPKFGKHNRPNLFYPLFVNPNIVDKDGFCPVKADNSDPNYSIKIEPYNSQGIESCWRWGTKKVIENSLENTLNSNLIAKRKQDGTFGIFEKYRKTTYKVKSIWDDNSFLTETGTIDMKKLGFDKGEFDFPKPVALVKQCIELCTNENDIILDFFGGSGTTGHATFELNETDNQKRKFILTQLPEATAEKSEAYKSGYKKISDITIERNKRVVQNIIKEKETKQPDLFTGDKKEDALQGLGFKVFKLQKSNFPRVDFAPDPEKTEEENIELLKTYIANKELQLVNAFNKPELLTEILLKNGYNLNYKLSLQTQFASNEVQLASDSEKETLICLDVVINPETVDYFKTNTDKKFICLERALDTTKKYNLKHYLGDKFNAF
ncbi:site-specific DNA-methyltransferase [Flavobacterium croceum]|jgi:adenine-specific DNA-methyltransferase|uniref:site-specific DNA-methyltransferase n=1 Tax=Flavobacterium croceum TaxID=370975 RepID=UPI0024A7DD02|nr:site-specific DNA-methyltransferase [Flavobacterium croceum]